MEFSEASLVYLRIMLLKKILYYLNPKNYFRSSTKDVNLKMMHGINKISILMFLFALGVMLYRWLK